jgi:hypothetical protein
MPVRQIAPRLGAARRLQFGLEELRGNFHDIVKACALLLALHVSFRHLRHGEARLPRQPLDGLGEAHALLLDEEGEDVAGRLAAEAVVAAFPVIDMEGRRLLAMERAAGPIVALARIGLPPVPRHLPPDDGGNRHPATDVIKE